MNSNINEKLLTKCKFFDSRTNGATPQSLHSNSRHPDSAPRRSPSSDMHPFHKAMHTVGLSAQTVAFVREMARRSGWNVTVIDHARCGALHQYMGLARTHPLRAPSLFLIDVRNDMEGRLSTISWIKGNEWSRRAPVVVICRVALLPQVDAMSWRGLNGVVSCDAGLDIEKSVVESICHFWLNTNITAPQGSTHAETGGGPVGGCDLLRRPVPRMLAA